MNRRPDVIRTLVMVFTVGLLVSGLTTLAVSDDSDTTASAPATPSPQAFTVPVSVSRGN